MGSQVQQGQHYRWNRSHFTSLPAPGLREFAEIHASIEGGVKLLHDRLAEQLQRELVRGCQLNTDCGNGGFICMAAGYVAILQHRFV
jgi:hypothetical protein